MECEDSLREILYRLPSPDLKNFKQVNKECRSLISNRDFKEDKHRVMGDNAIVSIYNREEQQFEFFSIRSWSQESAFISSLKLPSFFEFDDNMPPPLIIGSYKGLIGIKMNYVDYMLSNPVTDECLCYTGPAILVTDPVVVDLCHNGSTDEYMAVVIGTFSHAFNNISCVELINFSTNESIIVDVRERDLTPGLQGIGTVVCGVPHWVKKDRESKRAVLFDPIMGMFDDIELPKGGEEKVVVGLGSVERQHTLSVVLQGFKDGYYVEIWVLKEYGDMQSWTYISKILCLNIKNEWEYVNVIGLKSLIIWLCHKLSIRETEIPMLITYDPDNEKSYNDGGLSKKGTVLNITSYEPSFVSPLWSRINKVIHMLSLEFDKTFEE